MSHVLHVVLLISLRQKQTISFVCMVTRQTIGLSKRLNTSLPAVLKSQLKTTIARVNFHLGT